jgi:hypothetical protein
MKAYREHGANVACDDAKRGARGTFERAASGTAKKGPAEKLLWTKGKV